MGDDVYDYFAWAKTGHFNLIVGFVASVVLLGALVNAIEAGSTVRILVCSFIFLGALSGFVEGIRQLRARRNS